VLLEGFRVPGVVSQRGPLSLMQMLEMLTKMVLFKKALLLNDQLPPRLI
jgi:hypothetical protein